MFTYFREFSEHLRALGYLPRLVIKLGFILGTCYCIAALYALWLLPRSLNYFDMLHLARGCIEAAPGAVATAFLSAFICDYVEKKAQE